MARISVIINICYVVVKGIIINESGPVLSIGAVFM